MPSLLVALVGTAKTRLAGLGDFRESKDTAGPGLVKFVNDYSGLYMYIGVSPTHFAYAWEMERWAKFRCQEISFSNSLDHINWSLIHLLLELEMWLPSMPIRSSPRTLITGQLARLSENSSTNFCTAPSRWCGNFDGQVASNVILKFRTLVFLFWVPLLALFVLAVSDPRVSCRMLQMQAAVCSVGRGPRVTTLYSAATHRERCWKREVASLCSTFGNQIWLTWSSMRCFQQEVACVPGGDLQIYIARHMYRKFTG